MIHGMVDRPLTFTIDDLKRLPSVTRLHFIECAGHIYTASICPCRSQQPPFDESVRSEKRHDHEDHS